MDKWDFAALEKSGYIGFCKKGKTFEQVLEKFITKILKTWPNN